MILSVIFMTVCLTVAFYVNSEQIEATIQTTTNPMHNPVSQLSENDGAVLKKLNLPPVLRRTVEPIQVDEATESLEKIILPEENRKTTHRRNTYIIVSDSKKLQATNANGQAPVFGGMHPPPTDGVQSTTRNVDGYRGGIGGNGLPLQQPARKPIPGQPKPNVPITTLLVCTAVKSPFAYNNI